MTLFEELVEERLPHAGHRTRPALEARQVGRSYHVYQQDGYAAVMLVTEKVGSVTCTEEFGIFPQADHGVTKRVSDAATGEAATVYYRRTGSLDLFTYRDHRAGLLYRYTYDAQGNLQNITVTAGEEQSAEVLTGSAAGAILVQRFEGGRVVGAHVVAGAFAGRPARAQVDVWRRPPERPKTSEKQLESDPPSPETV